MIVLNHAEIISGGATLIIAISGKETGVTTAGNVTIDPTLVDTTTNLGVPVVTN